MDISPVLVWFFIGTIFLLSELFLPGFVLLFFGIGAWTAAILAAFAHSFETELAVFIVATVLSLILLRQKLMVVFKGRARASKNEGYMDGLAGQNGIVTRAITPGRPGEITMRGSYWQAVADEDLAEGTAVKILRQAEDNSLTLRVASAVKGSPAEDK